MDSATLGGVVGGEAEVEAEHLAFSVNRGYNFQMEGGGLNSISSLWVLLILPCRTPVTLFSAFPSAKGRYPTMQGEK